MIGHPAMVYIGSSTSIIRGLRARLSDYRREKTLPRRIREMMALGYERTHIFILAHCPIPEAKDVPLLRTVVIALEAAFACALWAMWSKDSWYGFDGLCPWSRHTFEWSGLCSHNSLIEGIRGFDEMDFAPEKLEEISAATREKNRLYQDDYQKQLRANPTEKFKNRMKTHNEKQKPGTKARQAEAIAAEKYRCEPCNVNCRDAASLRLHKTKPRHKKMVEMGDKDYECAPCGFSNRYLSNYKQHLKTAGHLRTVPEASASSA